jgi:hypothetical protein
MSLITKILGTANKRIKSSQKVIVRVSTHRSKVCTWGQDCKVVKKVDRAKHDTSMYGNVTVKPINKNIPN